MRRTGFSMIELVFIMVIMGILAAVAIPRLAMSREDACYAKLRTNLSEAQSELSREYTKRFMQGKTISDDEVKKIFEDTLMADTKSSCGFSVASKSDIKMTIGTGKAQQTLQLKVDNNTLTKTPAITCDTSNTMCIKLTGKTQKKSKN